MILDSVNGRLKLATCEKADQTNNKAIVVALSHGILNFAVETLKISDCLMTLDELTRRLKRTLRQEAGIKEFNDVGDRGKFGRPLSILLVKHGQDCLGLA